MFNSSLSLQGKWVQLEPLQQNHFDALYQAAQDERIWTYATLSGFGNQFSVWFDKALQACETQQQFPFLVRRISDKKIVGTTRYYDINFKHHRVAIGYTWYMPDAWGSPINPECKFLLLQYAFEILQFNRVEFYIDARNLHSYSALKKLGAKQEGILRQHIILENGFVRDSIVFSLLQAEWPQVKTELEKRLIL